MTRAELHELLRADGWTVKDLAREAGVSRAHLSEVLHGKPGRGGIVRRKVVRFLSPELRRALQWDQNGRLLNHADS